MAVPTVTDPSTGATLSGPDAAGNFTCTIGTGSPAPPSVPDIIVSSAKIVAATNTAPIVLTTDPADPTLKIVSGGVFISGVVGMLGGSLSISAMTGNGTNPIVVTVPSTTALALGLSVTIYGVGGNTAANGTWRIVALTSTTLSIPATGNGTYTSGGVVQYGPPNSVVNGGWRATADGTSITLLDSDGTTASAYGGGGMVTTTGPSPGAVSNKAKGIVSSANPIIVVGPNVGVASVAFNLWYAQQTGRRAVPSLGTNVVRENAGRLVNMLLGRRQVGPR